MLSTVCWVVIGPSEVPIDGKVYLRREDADLALDTARVSPAWAQFRETLGVRERTLVLAFGVTDRQVPSEVIVEGLVSLSTLP